MTESGRRRLLAAAVLVSLATPLLAVGWSVHLALGVRDNLEAVKDALARLRTAVGTRHVDELAGTLSDAGRHANEARRLTSGPDWSLLTHLPLVGDGATTARGLAGGAAELVDILTRVERAGMPLLAARPGSLGDLRGVLSGLRKAAPVLADAVARLGRMHAGLAATTEHTGVDALDQARALVLREVDQVRGRLEEAAAAAGVIPSMLGQDGPRRYFLAFQTNAEARGTGGLVGAFGVLEADHGKIEITGLSANNGLPLSPRPVADHGRAYEERYGPSALRLLSISNLSPHFPYAAQTWAGLWEHRYHRRIDGAIAFDPVGLSALLGLIGPVTVPGGEKVTAANVVELTERTAYSRYTDPVARKRFLIRIAGAVADSLSGHLTGPARLLPVLNTMARERRIQIWSRHDDEERRLTSLSLAGALPSAPGPYAGLVVNNSAGGKLDYYLGRSLDYTLGPCRQGWRSSAVRIRLSNDVPRGKLPTYVTDRLDSPGTSHRVGSNLSWVSFYAGVGARLTGARLDGAPVKVISEVERSHPIYSLLLELGPRRSKTLELDLAEPASVLAPVVPVQPLVRPQVTRIEQDARGCTG